VLTGRACSTTTKRERPGHRPGARFQQLGAELLAGPSASAAAIQAEGTTIEAATAATDIAAGLCVVAAIGVAEGRLATTTTATGGFDHAHAIRAFVVIETGVSRRATTLAVTPTGLTQRVTKLTLRCTGEICVTHLSGAAGLIFAAASRASEFSEVNLGAGQAITTGVARAAGFVDSATRGALAATATTATAADGAFLAHAAAAALTISTAVGTRAGCAQAVAWAGAIFRDASATEATRTTLTGVVGAAAITRRAAGQADAGPAAIGVVRETGVAGATGLSRSTAGLLGLTPTVDIPAVRHTWVAGIGVHVGHAAAGHHSGVVLGRVATGVPHPGTAVAARATATAAAARSVARVGAGAGRFRVIAFAARAN
jgi:hypothetical protein